MEIVSKFIFNVKFFALQEDPNGQSQAQNKRLKVIPPNMHIHKNFINEILWQFPKNWH